VRDHQRFCRRVHRVYAESTSRAFRVYLYENHLWDVADVEKIEEFGNRWELTVTNSVENPTYVARPGHAAEFNNPETRMIEIVG
jgi:hypothetical protein